MSSQQDEATSGAEGIPLLQDNRQQQGSPTSQQQQNYYANTSPSSSPPQMMVPGPGNYGATANNNDIMAAYAMAAAQYEYYNQDPAAAAAAAAAMQQQQQGGFAQPPNPYFFQGYPPGAGSMPGGYPMPPMQYPPQMQYNVPPPAPQSRPPRHDRRNSGKSPIPSPQSSREKNFPQQQQFSAEQQQRQQQPVLSGIPPLQDIFSNDPANSNNQGPSMSPTASSNKVYNAPPRAPPSGSSKKVQPVLVRTNSSEKMGSSHRRSSSDLPLRGGGVHRRTGSDLPPKGGSHRRTNSGAANRGRSYSGSSLGTGGGGSKRGHRRMDSAGSVRTMDSAMSQASVRSQISKSAMFGGVDEGGRVQLHFPLEAVRVHMQDKNDKSLKLGELYMYRAVTDYDQYEEYHRITADLEQGGAPQWESMGIVPQGSPLKCCSCNCNNCNGCFGKRELLPQTNYLLPIEDSGYRRVVGEIADAYGMPCGLYFCGHHEDVAYPSILIAVFIVAVFFAAMMYVAVTTGLLQ